MTEKPQQAIVHVSNTEEFTDEEEEDVVEIFLN